MASRVLCRMLLLTSISLHVHMANAEETATLTFTSYANAIEYFADMALLVDRGLAIKPFGPSADEWILNKLKRSKVFQQSLGVSDEALAVLCKCGASAAATTDNENEKARANLEHSPFISCEGFDIKEDDVIRLCLESQLNEAQKDRLAKIYLDIEGLLALRRPCFRSQLHLSLDQQLQIVKLATARIHDRSHGTLRLQGGMFALSNDETQLLPRLKADLRRESAALDHDIIAQLSEEQKELLAELVCEAIDAMSEVHGPGASARCRIVLPSE